MGREAELIQIINKNLNKLKIIDINLQIEAAHIKEANGVDVIARNIKDVIDEIQRELAEVEKEVNHGDNKEVDSTAGSDLRK